MTIQTTLRSTSRLLAALPLVPALLALQAVAAQAGPCLPINQPLLKLPEITTKNGVLSGTIILTDEQRRLIFRSPGMKPGQPGSFFDCQPQRVRAFISPDANPKVAPSPGNIIDPYPGPLLRARLGDIVKLTFVNQIDANRFPYSIDQGEKRFLTQFIASAGCDISSPGDPRAGYPLAGNDAFPDCFHGSSTGNIHFHGTHTNPNSTGDNVLLEIRPSPRAPSPTDPRTRTPTITPATANKAFADFFTACEKSLRGDVLSRYPQTWLDKPLGPYTASGTWTNQQMQLLQAYDAQTKQSLWTSNKAQIEAGAWPQYYIGAYPYCFVIPQYTAATWPPPPGSKSPRMGQSPGTHWYHAHKHGSTAINVSNGMTGVFIIEGDYDDKLNLFYGPGWTQTQPVLVINQLTTSPNLLRLPDPVLGGGGPGTQDKGPEFSVNGRSQPLIEMAPGEVQMWRIANTSGRSGIHFGGMAPGLQWMQLAQDGVQFTYDNFAKSKNQVFMMAAGNRADLLVKAPATPGTYPVLVKHVVDPTDVASAFPVVLLQVRVAGTPMQGKRSQFIDQASFPAQPPFLTNITDAEVTGEVIGGVRIGTIANPRTLTFASTPPNVPAPNNQSYAMHTINGQKFQDGADTAIAVTLSAVEEWKIVNETYGPLISHPFHIHINPFQVVEVFNPRDTVRDPNLGTLPKYVFALPSAQSPLKSPLQCLVNPQDPSTFKDCHNDTSSTTARIWWDVFPIPSGIQVTIDGTQYNIPGNFRMRSRFVDYAGQYVLHCHILAHEDRGMMVMVQVSAPDKKTDPKLFKHH